VIFFGYIRPANGLFVVNEERLMDRSKSLKQQFTAERAVSHTRFVRNRSAVICLIIVKMTK